MVSESEQIVEVLLLIAVELIQRLRVAILRGEAVAAQIAVSERRLERGRGGVGLAAAEVGIEDILAGPQPDGIAAPVVDLGEVGNEIGGALALAGKRAEVLGQAIQRILHPHYIGHEFIHAGRDIAQSLHQRLLEITKTCVYLGVEGRKVRVNDVQSAVDLLLDAGKLRADLHQAVLGDLVRAVIAAFLRDINGSGRNVEGICDDLDGVFGKVACIGCYFDACCNRASRIRCQMYAGRCQAKIRFLRFQMLIARSVHELDLRVGGSRCGCQHGRNKGIGGGKRLLHLRCRRLVIRSPDVVVLLHRGNLRRRARHGGCRLRHTVVEIGDIGKRGIQCRQHGSVGLDLGLERGKVGAGVEAGIFGKHGEQSIRDFVVVSIAEKGVNDNGGVGVLAGQQGTSAQAVLTYNR